MLEIADISRAIMGLGVVLLLIVAVLWLVRRFGPHGVVGGKPAGRRLTMVESLAIDPRNRLVLVRQDDHEHLLVIAASGAATVVRSSGDAMAAVPPVGRAAAVDNAATGRVP